MNQTNTLSLYGSSALDQAAVGFLDANPGISFRNSIFRPRLFGAIHVDGICDRCGHWHMLHPDVPPGVCNVSKGKR